MVGIFAIVIIAAIPMKSKLTQTVLLTTINTIYLLIVILGFTNITDIELLNGTIANSSIYTMPAILILGVTILWQYHRTKRRFLHNLLIFAVGAAAKFGGMALGDDDGWKIRTGTTLFHCCAAAGIYLLTGEDLSGVSEHSLSDEQSLLPNLRFFSKSPATRTVFEFGVPMVPRTDL